MITVLKKRLLDVITAVTRANEDTNLTLMESNIARITSVAQQHRQTHSPSDEQLLLLQLPVTSSLAAVNDDVLPL